LHVEIVCGGGPPKISFRRTVTLQYRPLGTRVRLRAGTATSGSAVKGAADQAIVPDSSANTTNVTDITGRSLEG